MRAELRARLSPILPAHSHSSLSEVLGEVGEMRVEVSGLYSRVSEFNTAIANVLVQLECSWGIPRLNKCLADISLQSIHTSES